VPTTDLTEDFAALAEAVSGNWGSESGVGGCLLWFGGCCGRRFGSGK